MSQNDNERQKRRRLREKEWLLSNGWSSWEAVHTALMNGETRLTMRAADECPVCDGLGDIVKNEAIEECPECDGTGIHR